MSYSAIDALTNDILFGGRVRACCVEQAVTFREDDRDDFVALADDLLRGGGATTLAFIRMVAAAPGLADMATGPDGLESNLIDDPAILASVHHLYPTVADLFFAADGTPRLAMEGET